MPLLCAVFSAQALTLGVTEGVTYRATEAEIEAKFAPIAKMISLATKQPVKIQIIPSYNALRDALKQGQLDAAFIHPAHVSFESIKTGAYKSVAWTTGFTEYKVSFLCKEPEAIKNWTTVNGKGLVTPDADSITAIMTRSMLRENKLNSATDVKLASHTFSRCRAVLCRQRLCSIRRYRIGRCHQGLERKRRQNLRPIARYAYQALDCF